jgi:hypothetical protein
MRRIIKPLYVIVCALNDMLTTTLKERSWVICIIVLVFWPVMSEELGIVVVLGGLGHMTSPVFGKQYFPASSSLGAVSNMVSRRQKHIAPWPASLLEVAQTCDPLSYVVRIDKDAIIIVGWGIAPERQRPQNDLLETEGYDDDQSSSAYRCPTRSL